jgi:hypothetical protein
LSGLRILGLAIVVAVAMKRKLQGFCCCCSCKAVFDSRPEFLGHLSVDGFCRGGADRAVREIARMILLSRS